MTEDPVLPPRAVAAWTGLRVTTLCEWRKAGEGPRWLRMGARRIGYRRSDVKAWLAEQARQSRAG